MKRQQALMNPIYKTGLALGGGSILGAAHIGILRALEERNISIDCISGTSIGSLVAALYAFGISTDEIEEIALELDWGKISSFKLSKLSLFTNKKLRKGLESKLGNVNIEDANIPLAIIACDISTGEKVTLTKGPLGDAVMASTAIPGIFNPVTIGRHLLVDGGIAENVPVSALKVLSANLFIAVNLNEKVKYNEPKGVFDVISNAMNIALDTNTKSRTKFADMLIAPDLAMKSRTSTDPDEIRHMVQIGYEEAIRMLDAPITLRQWLRAVKKQILRWFY